MTQTCFWLDNILLLFNITCCKISKKYTNKLNSEINIRFPTEMEVEKYILKMYYVIRYEESQLHQFSYQLHVKLLGADKSTVIAEHAVNPTEDLSTYSHTWKEVGQILSPSTIIGPHPNLSHCMCLCWPAGVTCVLWLWTWGEICPLQAPSEEQFPQWLLHHDIYRQHSDCKTSQKQPIGSNTVMTLLLLHSN